LTKKQNWFLINIPNHKYIRTKTREADYGGFLASQTHFSNNTLTFYRGLILT